jgi:hypothetical protein
MQYTPTSAQLDARRQQNHACSYQPVNARRQPTNVMREDNRPMGTINRSMYGVTDQCVRLIDKCAIIALQRQAANARRQLNNV